MGTWFKKHWLLTIFLVIICLGIGAGLGGGKPKEILPPEVSVSATKLFSDYSANELAAEAKYKGKVLEVSGTIGSIGKDILGSPFVTLKGDLIGDVQCMLTKEDASKGASLSQGRQITVVGTANSSKLVNIILDDCRIK